MENARKAFANTLKRLDFDKHRAHRWLFLKRDDREELLRQHGLNEIIDLNAPPIHLGNIARVDQQYDWGQIVFQSHLGKFVREQPCSVYAAFEYFIRSSHLFPSFISMRELKDCDQNSEDCLAVYGSPFNLASQPAQERGSIILKMLKLHQVQRRSDLLIKRVCEVSDADLFQRYFGHMQAKDETSASPPPRAEEVESGLDHVNVWHS